MALTRTCKEDYYKDYFETNKKDVKKIWNGLRNLINIKKSNKTSKQIMLNINEKTTTDNKITANHFDEFFTSIAGKLHRFFYKNSFYKNHQAQNCQKIKNILRIMARLKYMVNILESPILILHQESPLLTMEYLLFTMEGLQFQKTCVRNQHTNQSKHS